MVDLGTDDFRLRMWRGFPGGSKLNSGRVHCASGSAGISTLSEGLDNERSNIELDNATRNGDYLGQVLQNVIVRIPTVRMIGFISWFMSLGILLS
jgi:hypothetical protein